MYAKSWRNTNETQITESSFIFDVYREFIDEDNYVDLSLGQENMYIFFKFLRQKGDERSYGTSQMFYMTLENQAWLDELA
jgi:hypothetical protein